MPETPHQIVERRLAAWAVDLGPDRVVYTNHVLRVLSFCDLLAPPGTPAPSTREEFLTAAVCHDLGIWTAGTFDYLDPSEALARQWLTDHGHETLIPLVDSMIDDHHKIRRSRDPRPEVELFRRGDLVDFSAGQLRFGISRSDYRAVVDRYPNTGFRRLLAHLATHRVRTHPLSPLPMVKW
ncbi:hypothetical protein [Nocardia sp. NBC_00511]|uniref:hypothetical protein n=1 Tax=Nocardia sp. NBC_00511 TaxID=2903591 RepID=UPI0030E25DA7